MDPNRFEFNVSQQMEYQGTTLNEESFIKLAEAFIKDMSYLDELDGIKRRLAEKYEIEADFLGMDYWGGNLSVAASSLLGDDFSYWYYDCEQDYDKFNENITFEDGTHPNVHSLAELWKFSKDLEETK